ncbi:MAG: hypothetical protein OEM82_03235 [Acidobacteriota bacterium]|nr:hypothetical protein [Acidobacteriota bacterium]MDH3531049.1 hypothetical protein [Acidobacteriota bacterium]
MIWFYHIPGIRKSALKATAFLFAVFVLSFLAAENVQAQKKFSKTYPAGKNIRLQLTNRTGTITVRGWDRKSVQISAVLEKPIANITPKNLSGTILIDVVRDNKGRNDVGEVNFTVYVPYESAVDIETRIGNLIVASIQGGLVRAHISSEGDITLTNIGAASVSAKNVIGDIFYDGVFQPNGIYRFYSMQGNVNLRIPLRSSFRLVATAPSTRSISLGSFSNASMRFVGKGRRVVGKVGAGSASVTVTNQQGSISLLRR